MKYYSLLFLAALILPLSACHEDDDLQTDWYVNSSTGWDSADGDYCCPLRTITEAMRRANTNDVIFVEPATSYTIYTGETFPIIVKANVTIEGNTSVKGTDTFVEGGGAYTVTGGTIPSTNATFILREGARLRGIKVKNINTWGIGVGVDNATAYIELNSIMENDSDGIALFQAGSTLITNNDILSNTGNGVQTYDSTTPILRGNNISSNKLDGVRTHDQSIPDLGTTNFPGNNTLQSQVSGVGLNHDGNTTPAPVTLHAMGNIWMPDEQGATSSGGYSTMTATGPILQPNPPDKKNYLITNTGAQIEF
jgi:parallel beta-helix repeat protein